MSDSARRRIGQAESPGSISGILNAGIIGLVLGAGAMFLAMHYFGYRIRGMRRGPSQTAPEVVHVPGFIAMPPGDAGGNSKRHLTSLVGRLEILTREGLDLRVNLEPEQAKKLAALLSRLSEGRQMDFAQADMEYFALRSLLTPAQNELLDTIGMPRAGGPSPAEFGEFADNPFKAGRYRDLLLDLLERLPPEYDLETSGHTQDRQDASQTVASPNAP